MTIWKQGDTQPPLIIDCFEGTGQPADLSGATTVTVRVTRRGVLMWQRAVPGVASGVVTVPLQGSDVATAGTFYVKVVVVWPNGSTQHYPPGDRYMTMTVTP